MDARLVTLTAKPGGADALTAFWDDDVVTRITAQTGSRGFFVLSDSDNDRVVLVSLWDSAADADATGPTYLSHMAAVADRVAGPPSPAAMRVVVAAQTPLSVAAGGGSPIPAP
jgi:hypothetical protein